MSLGTIYILDEIGRRDGKGIGLKDIVSQAKAQPEATAFKVKIESNGGNVNVGYDIYDYLKSLRVPITTEAIGMVASIATIIFLAGDERVMLPGSSLMIHNPWLKAQGGFEANDLIALGTDMKKREDKMVKFYSKHTGNTKEAISPLMRDETSITPDEAIELGFATSKVEEMAEPLAYINLNKVKMSEKKDAKTILKLLGEALGLSSEPEIKNLKLKTATGTELVFADLDETTVVALGSKGQLEGKPAIGEVLMANGDTFVFDNGALAKIIEKEAAPVAQFDKEAFLKEVGGIVSEAVNGLRKEMEQKNTSIQEGLDQNNEIFNSLKSIVSTAQASVKGAGAKPGEKGGEKGLFNEVKAVQEINKN